MKGNRLKNSKNPELLSSDDVKEYLTYMAVKRKVSSTTQNQAFNALLFFYRHILHREFGKIDGVVRAKRRPYIPVVLSREEIESILKFMETPSAFASGHSAVSVRGCLAGMTNCERNDKLHKTYAVMHEI